MSAVYNKIFSLRKVQGGAILLALSANKCPTTFMKAKGEYMGEKVSIYVDSDKGLHLYKVWRSGQWRDPLKTLRPVKKFVAAPAKEPEPELPPVKLVQST